MKESKFFWLNKILIFFGFTIINYFFSYLSYSGLYRWDVLSVYPILLFVIGCRKIFSDILLNKNISQIVFYPIKFKNFLIKLWIKYNILCMLILFAHIIGRSFLTQSIDVFLIKEEACLLLKMNNILCCFAGSLLFCVVVFKISYRNLYIIERVCYLFSIFGTRYLYQFIGSIFDFRANLISLIVVIMFFVFLKDKLWDKLLMYIINNRFNDGSNNSLNTWFTTKLPKYIFLEIKRYDKVSGIVLGQMLQWGIFSLVLTGIVFQSQAFQVLP